MPRTPEQNNQIRDRRKTKILHHALVLFALKGFDAVTIDDITKSANCSHGLFYHYYNSKEEVYNALMQIKETEYTEFELPIEQIKAAGGIKGLKILSDFVAKFISGPDEAVYLSRLNALRRFTTRSFHESLLGEDPYPFLLELVKEGQSQGDVGEGDPQEIVNLFLDFVNGATYRRIYEGADKYQLVTGPTILRIFKKSF